MMFLHLVDDEKFTDGSIQLFESCDPGNHRYVIVRGNDDKTTRYAQSPLIEFIVKDSPEYDTVFCQLGKFTAVFAYSLFNPYHLDMVNRAPDRAVVVWFFGGGELLTTKKYWKTVMLPATRRLYYKHQVVPWLQRNLKKYSAIMRRGQLKELIRPIQKVVASGPVSQANGLDTNLTKAIARVDYIAPVIPEDYEQLKKMAPTQAELLDWNFPIENFSLDSVSDWQITGQNWLVGNAARYALNHLEMMKMLRKIKGHQAELIVPLSYGDNDLYRNDIIRFGSKWFDSRFRAIVEFMPVMKYYSLISSCSVGFFNTKRQHAVGNILFMLYLGSKVFLRQENPFYHYLKTRDAAVFSIQSDLQKEIGSSSQPLTEELIERNKRIVKQLVSKKAFLERTCKMLFILRQHHKVSMQKGP